MQATPDNLDGVSARDYGAVGDGVTDDTAALQAYVDWCVANARPIYLPAGTYIVTDTIAISSGWVPNFHGDGAEQTTIKTTSGDTVLHITGSAALRQSTLSGFSIAGTRSGTTFAGSGHGIFVDYPAVAQEYTIDDVGIYDVGGNGIRVEGGQAVFFSRLRIDHCGDDLFFVSSPQPIPTSTLKDSYFHCVRDGKYAVNIQAGQWRLENVNGIDRDAGGFSLAGWGVFGGTSGSPQQAPLGYPVVRLSNCNVEDFATYGLKFETGHNCAMEGGIFLSAEDVSNIVAALIPSGETAINVTRINVSLCGLKSGSTWKNGKPIHSVFSDAAVDGFGEYWSDNDGITVASSYVTYTYVFENVFQTIDNVKLTKLRGFTWAGGTTVTEGTGTMILENNQNAVTGYTARNTSNGASAQAQFRLENGNTSGAFALWGAGATESGVLIRNVLFAFAGDPAGMAFISTAGPIRFAVGDTGSDFEIDLSGRIRIVNASTPASGATGAAGTITWDANYLYLWSGTNTPKRIALSSY